MERSGEEGNFVKAFEETEVRIEAEEGRSEGREDATVTPAAKKKSRARREEEKERCVNS